MVHRLSLLYLTVFVIMGCADRNTPIGSESTNPPVASAPESNATATPKQVIQAPVETVQQSAAKTVAEARAELQARIDRVLGGQSIDTVMTGTISIWEVGHRLDSIDVVRLVQEYDSKGIAIPNSFVGLVKCKRTHKTLGTEEIRDFRIFAFKFEGDKWSRVYLE